MFIVLCFVLKLKLEPDLYVEKDVMHLLSTDKFCSYETTESTNVLNCDLATYSAIINNMVADGFNMMSKEESKDFIDIVLKKDSLSFRLHYDSNEVLTSICDVYEKSYIPFTYINENK